MPRIKIYLLLLLTGAFLTSQAQFYSKRYNIAGTNGFISSIQVRDDTIYGICEIIDTLPSHLPAAAFVKFDKYGTLLTSEIFRLPNRAVYSLSNSLIHTRDGGFAYGGSVAELNGLWGILIVKLDRSGHLKWHREITDSLYSLFYGEVFIQDSFSNFYLSGHFSHSNTNDNEIHVTKTDSNGNLTFKKEFIHSDTTNVVGGICINKKGQLVLGGGGFVITNNDFRTIKIFNETYEIDTTGQLINYVIGSDTNGPFTFNIIANRNNEYLASNAYNCYADRVTTHFKGSICKIDSNFSKVWELDIGPCSQNSQFLTNNSCPDETYLATGIVQDETDTINNYTNGWIVKYTDDGRILWSRQYAAARNSDFTTDYNRFTSVGFFSDGSIICAGESQNFDDTISSQKGWLLHLDTAGCLPDSNSCGIVNGVSESQATASGSIHLYPNPSSDQVTFDYILEGVGISHLAIYDILGRPVYTTDINDSHGNFTINVRQWSAGLYTYQVTSDIVYPIGGTLIVTH